MGQPKSKERHKRETKAWKKEPAENKFPLQKKSLQKKEAYADKERNELPQETKRTYTHRVSRIGFFIADIFQFERISIAHVANMGCFDAFKLKASSSKNPNS
jgi:hypothetical protein